MKDFSTNKIFYCLFHNLQITRLHAHGEELPSLKLSHSYLTKGR